MTEAEREELIEKMAKAAWESDGAESWEKARETGRKSYLRESRAALAVAEPVIREQCARIADRAAANPDFETSVFLDGIAFGARVVAAAIREGRNCVPEGEEEE